MEIVLEGVKKLEKDFEQYIPQIEEIKKRMYNMAYLYLGAESKAIDAVDEAVYEAFRNYKKLKQPEFFKTWITRILINICKKELKKSKKFTEFDENDDKAQEVFDALPLREAVVKLPEEIKQVIILRYFNDMTVVSVADILGIPQGTVATRCRKGLSLLKLELEDKDE